MPDTTIHQLDRYRSNMRDPVWRATHRDLVLRVIAFDLRRIAEEIEMLQEPGGGGIPEQLAGLVSFVVQRIGNAPPNVDVATIIETVAAAYHVRVVEMVSARRTQHLALARQVAMYLIREITELSFPQIGARFGRDHSTAIHAHQMISRRVAAEQGFSALMLKLKQTTLTPPGFAPALQESA